MLQTLLLVCPNGNYTNMECHFEDTYVFGQSTATPWTGDLIYTFVDRNLPPLFYPASGLMDITSYGDSQMMPVACTQADIPIIGRK